MFICEVYQGHLYDSACMTPHPASHSSSSSLPPCVSQILKLCPKKKSTAAYTFCKAMGLLGMHFHLFENECKSAQREASHVAFQLGARLANFPFSTCETRALSVFKEREFRFAKRLNAKHRETTVACHDETQGEVGVGRDSCRIELLSPWPCE